MFAASAVQLLLCTDSRVICGIQNALHKVMSPRVKWDPYATSMEFWTSLRAAHATIAQLPLCNRAVCSSSQAEFVT